MGEKSKKNLLVRKIIRVKLNFNCRRNHADFNAIFLKRTNAAPIVSKA
jgi:hypothetical protein